MVRDDKSALFSVLLWRVSCRPEAPASWGLSPALTAHGHTCVAGNLVPVLLDPRVWIARVSIAFFKHHRTNRSIPRLDGSSMTSLNGRSEAAGVVPIDVLGRWNGMMRRISFEDEAFEAEWVCRLLERGRGLVVVFPSTPHTEEICPRIGGNSTGWCRC